MKQKDWAYSNLEMLNQYGALKKMIDLEEIPDSTYDVSHSVLIQAEKKMKEQRIIDLNQMINTCFYQPSFIKEINDIALKHANKYYEEIEGDVTQKEADFEEYRDMIYKVLSTDIKDFYMGYIRPVLIKNSLFDVEINSLYSLKDISFKAFLDSSGETSSYDPEDEYYGEKDDKDSDFFNVPDIQIRDTTFLSIDDEGFPFADEDSPSFFDDANYSGFMNTENDYRATEGNDEIPFPDVTSDENLKSNSYIEVSNGRFKYNDNGFMGYSFAIDGIGGSELIRELYFRKELLEFIEEVTPLLKDQNHRTKRLLLYQQKLEKYLINREIMICPAGLFIRNRKEENNTPMTVNDPQNLDLSFLSSGEAKILILFTAATMFNEIILMDEPELSLSLVWQEQLLPDLLDLTREKLSVATHSPYIVNDESVQKYIHYLP